MTGLDLETDALIEIAVVVTDSDLNLLDEGIDLVIKPPAEALEQMDEVVREMHTKSGLLDALDQGITLEEAEEQVVNYVRQFVSEPGKAPLAGNTVGTDRAFLERDLLGLVNYLHYRIIDVSSVKELVRRWYPRAYYAAPEKAGGHRALADILESINELKYYRNAVFVADPGPSTEEARSIAADVVGSSGAAGADETVEVTAEATTDAPDTEAEPVEA